MKINSSASKFSSASEKFLSEFKEFVNDIKNKSYSLCYRILKDRKDAEDALQDAFLKLYKALTEKKYDGSSKLSTYFYRIVYNTAVEYYRKIRMKSFNVTSFEITSSSYKSGEEFNYTSELESTDSRLNTENILISGEVRNIITVYLDSLPEHYSLILTMSYINELTIKEISEILKIPEGTVKNRIFRAKEKLKIILFKRFREQDLMDYVIN